MKYDFDEIVCREGTDSVKLDFVQDMFGRTDVLPMWVADMDFRTPPFIHRAIRTRLEKDILGYTRSGDGYRPAIVDWVRQHYDWQIEPAMINYVPGVVCGIYICVQTFTEKGDKILIQQPVYHPFRIVPEGSGRQIVWNTLTRNAETFEMDLEALRRDIKGCRMMILCNPHNPAGIQWSRETLQQVAHICAQEGVLVVSDEIHCDMMLDGRKHIPFASVSEEAARISITLQAPSKTYNMPGIVASHAIVVNPELRERLWSYIENSDMDLGNVFAYDCVEACYSEEGDEWRRQMLHYVEGNIQLVEQELQTIPGIVAIHPHASFLVFLDCRGMGFPSQEELVSFMINEAHLGLNDGGMFGAAGQGYMRMNVGCPRSTVQQAMNQLRAAVERKRQNS